MLSDIFCIVGKPGLYKKVVNANGKLIVESLIDKKRIPVFARDRISTLADIQIYTNDGQIALSSVLTSIQKKENKQVINQEIKALSNDQLRAYLEQVLPDYDRERVYPTDIRKLLLWYNILINSGITEFEEKEEQK